MPMAGSRPRTACTGWCAFRRSIPTRGGIPRSPASNVYPVIDDRIKIDINEADVRVDMMRSGGAGGQHVNKTESAIRLTHIPTNIVVVCQNDRSQHRNRAQAWQMLRAKFYEAELKKREEKAAADQAAKTDIGWGHQIRSYVLQPYQMVKDLRTGVATSDTGARARRRSRSVHASGAGAEGVRHRAGDGGGCGVARRFELIVAAQLNFVRRTDDDLLAVAEQLSAGRGISADRPLRR